MEPAKTWYSAMSLIATTYGPVALPQPDPVYQSGKSSDSVPDVEGMSQSAATSALTGAGFQVQSRMVAGGGAPYGQVVGIDAGAGIPGSQVTIRVSDGSGASGGPGAGGGSGAGTGNQAPITGDGPMVVNVPGMPPITITPPR